MTDREARLITLIAQATLALEATMREQLDAINARLADLDAAVSRIVALHQADAAAFAAAQQAITDAEAVKAELAAMADKIGATVNTLNAA